MKSIILFFVSVTIFVLIIAAINNGIITLIENIKLSIQQKKEAELKAIEELKNEPLRLEKERKEAEKQKREEELKRQNDERNERWLLYVDKIKDGNLSFDEFVEKVCKPTRLMHQQPGDGTLFPDSLRDLYFFEECSKDKIDSYIKYDTRYFVFYFLVLFMRQKEPRACRYMAAFLCYYYKNLRDNDKNTPLINDVIKDCIMQGAGYGIPECLYLKGAFLYNHLFVDYTRYDEALVCFKKVVDISESGEFKYPYAYEMLGRCYDDCNFKPKVGVKANTQLAGNCYRKAIEIVEAESRGGVKRPDDLFPPYFIDGAPGEIKTHPYSMYADYTAEDVKTKIIPLINNLYEKLRFDHRLYDPDNFLNYNNKVSYKISITDLDKRLDELNMHLKNNEYEPIFSKARTSLEQILILYIKKYYGDESIGDIFDMIELLQKGEFLPKDIINKMHTIRKGGNSVIHGEKEASLEDASKIVLAFRDIVEHYKDQNI